MTYDHMLPSHIPGYTGDSCICGAFNNMKDNWFVVIVVNFELTIISERDNNIHGQKQDVIIIIKPSQIATC